MNNEIDYDYLDYVVLISNMEYNFSMEKDPISFLNAIKEGDKQKKSPTQKKKPYQILKIILMQARAQ